MYKREIKEAYEDLVKAVKEIDKQTVVMKACLHTLDKLGFDIEDIYQQLDNVGIEFYKEKEMLKNKLGGLNENK